VGFVRRGGAGAQLARSWDALGGSLVDFFGPMARAVTADEPTLSQGLLADLRRDHHELRELLTHEPDLGGAELKRLTQRHLSGGAKPARGELADAIVRLCRLTDESLHDPVPVGMFLRQEAR